MERFRVSFFSGKESLQMCFSFSHLTHGHQSIHSEEANKRVPHCFKERLRHKLLSTPTLLLQSNEEDGSNGAGIATCLGRQTGEMSEAYTPEMFAPG